MLFCEIYVIVLTGNAMIVTFIGHRNAELDIIQRNNLKSLILNLIDLRGADTFLFGSKSDFNAICLDIVTELSEIRPHINRIYVRAEYPYISESYENYLLKNYEQTYMPDKLINAGKAAYVERNYYMIDKADICIFYLDVSYIPNKNMITNKKGYTNKQSKSGTMVAYCYAIQKNKEIINLFRV